MFFYKVILFLLRKFFLKFNLLDFLRDFLVIFHKQKGNSEKNHFFKIRSFLRKDNVEELCKLPQLKGLYTFQQSDLLNQSFFSSRVLEEIGWYDPYKRKQDFAFTEGSTKIKKIYSRQKNRMKHLEKLDGRERPFLKDKIFNKKGKTMNMKGLYRIGNFGISLVRTGDVFSEKRWFKVPFFFAKINGLKKRLLREDFFLLKKKRIDWWKCNESFLVLNKNFLQVHSLYNTLSLTNIADDEYIFWNKDDFVFFPIFDFKKYDGWSIFLSIFYVFFEVVILFLFAYCWFGSIFEFFLFLSNNFLLVSPYALLSSNSNTFFTAIFCISLLGFFFLLFMSLFPDDDDEFTEADERSEQDLGVFPKPVSFIGDILYIFFYVIPAFIVWTFFVSKIGAFFLISVKVFLIPVCFFPLFLLFRFLKRVYNFWYTTPPHRYSRKNKTHRVLYKPRAMFFWNPNLHRENLLNKLFCKRSSDRFFNKALSGFAFGDNKLRRNPLRLRRKNLFFWSRPKNVKKNKSDVLWILQWINNNPISFINEKEKQFFPKKKNYKILNPLVERFWLYLFLRFKIANAEYLTKRWNYFFRIKNRNRSRVSYFRRTRGHRQWKKCLRLYRNLRLLYGYVNSGQVPPFHSLWESLQFVDTEKSVVRTRKLNRSVRSKRKFKTLKKTHFNTRLSSLGRRRQRANVHWSLISKPWNEYKSRQVLSYFPEPLNSLTSSYNKRFFDVLIKGFRHFVKGYWEYDTGLWSWKVLHLPQFLFLRASRRYPYQFDPVTNINVRLADKRLEDIAKRRFKLAAYLKTADKLSRSGRRIFGEYFFRSFLKRRILHGIFSRRDFDVNFLYGAFLRNKDLFLFDRLLERTISSFFYDKDLLRQSLKSPAEYRYVFRPLNLRPLASKLWKQLFFSGLERDYLHPFVIFKEKNVLPFFFHAFRLHQKLLGKNKLTRRFFQKKTSRINKKAAFMLPLKPFDFVKINSFYPMDVIKYRMELLKYIMRYLRHIEARLLIFPSRRRTFRRVRLLRKLGVCSYKRRLKHRLLSTFFHSLFLNGRFFSEFGHKRKKRNNFGLLYVNKVKRGLRLWKELYTTRKKIEKSFVNEAGEKAGFKRELRMWYKPYLRLLFLKQQRNRIWSFFFSYHNNFLRNLIKTPGSPFIQSKAVLNTFLTLSPFYTLEKKKDPLSFYVSFWSVFRKLRKYESYFLNVWKERLERKRDFHVRNVFNKKTFFVDTTNFSRNGPSLDFSSLEKVLGISSKLLSTKTEQSVLKPRSIRFSIRKNLEFDSQFLEDNYDLFNDLFLEYQEFLNYFRDKYIKEKISFFLVSDFSKFSKYLLFLKLYELYKDRLIQKWFFFDTVNKLSILKSNLHYQGYPRFSQFRVRQKKRLKLLFYEYLQWKRWRFLEKVNLQKRILQQKREYDSIKIFKGLFSEKRKFLRNMLSTGDRESFSPFMRNFFRRLDMGSFLGLEKRFLRLQSEKKLNEKKKSNFSNQVQLVRKMKRRLSSILLRAFFDKGIIGGDLSHFFFSRVLKNFLFSFYLIKDENLSFSLNKLLFSFYFYIIGKLMLRDSRTYSVFRNKIYYADFFLNGKFDGFFSGSLAKSVRRKRGTGVYKGFDSNLIVRRFFNMFFNSNVLNRVLNIEPLLNVFSSRSRLSFFYMPLKKEIKLGIKKAEPKYTYRKAFCRRYLVDVDKFFTNRFSFFDRYFAHKNRSSVFYDRRSFLNKRLLKVRNNFFGFIFQNRIPLLNELEIKKNFFLQMNRIIAQCVYFLIYDEFLKKKWPEPGVEINEDFAYFYYKLYCLLLRKYINYVFVNQKLQRNKDKSKVFSRIRNLFLLLRLRDVRKGEYFGKGSVLKKLYFAYYGLPQKVRIPYSRFVFWLLRQEKLNADLFNLIKYRRNRLVNKNFMYLYYPSLFIDRVIKRKRPFFFFGYSKHSSSIIGSGRLWEFLVKGSKFSLSYLTRKLDKRRLVVFRKQRKLYKQYVLSFLLKSLEFNEFLSEVRSNLYWEKYSSTLRGFSYGESKKSDDLKIQQVIDYTLNKPVFYYFFNRKFLHQFLNSLLYKYKQERLLLKDLFFLYSQFSLYRGQLFLRSLFRKSYFLRMVNLDSSIFDFRCFDEEFFEPYFFYKMSLANEFSRYYKYMSFIYHLFLFKAFNRESSNGKVKLLTLSDETEEVIKFKKERFMRRKFQFVRKYFLRDISSALNVRLLDRYVYLNELKFLKKLKKYNYILNSILEIFPIAKKRFHAFHDFFFDWNYSFFDLFSSDRKRRLNLIKKFFLNTYPGIRLSVPYLGNKSSLLSVKDNVFFHSKRKQYGVEVYPRYSSYTLRNRLFDLTYGRYKKIPLNVTFVEDPYKIQRYLKYYNLVSKRYNNRRRQDYKFVYNSFWQLYLSYFFQKLAIHYDIHKVDKDLFANEWGNFLLENFRLMRKSPSKSGNFFVQPREYGTLYYFLNPMFSKVFLKGIFDKYSKKKSVNDLRLRSGNNLNFRILPSSGEIRKVNRKTFNVNGNSFWYLLHTKFKNRQSNFLAHYTLWLRRKYGMKFLKSFKKNSFLWKDSFSIYSRPEFKSLFQRTHRIDFKAFFHPKPRRYFSGTKLRKKRGHRGVASYVFLKPVAAFAYGRIRIPSDKIRSKFFLQRQEILRKLRKAIFAFKAATGFLYLSYKVKEWNDRLIPHVRSGDSLRFLDMELEEAIISHTNDFFLPAYKIYRFSNIPFFEQYFSIFCKISDLSLNFSDSFLDGLILRLHSFWNRVFFRTSEEYITKDNRYRLNLVVRGADNFFTSLTNKNYSFFNTEMFFEGSSGSTAFRDLGSSSINSFLESDFLLAEQFRKIAYEEILKFSKQYEILVLSRKYQHFSNISSLLEKNLFFQKKISESLRLQLESIYALEPFFSSLYYGLELQLPVKFNIIQKNFFDHFFNLVNAGGDMSLFLKINIFNHVNRWLFLENRWAYTFNLFSILFRKLESFFFNKGLSFDDLSVINVLKKDSFFYSDGRYRSFYFFEKGLNKIYYFFIYIFRDNLFLSYFKYFFGFDWFYSTNLFYFFINFGLYFFFFFLYISFVLIYFFWFKKKFINKSPFFFNNFSEQIKTIPLFWEWGIFGGGTHVDPFFGKKLTRERKISTSDVYKQFEFSDHLADIYKFGWFSNTSLISGNSLEKGYDEDYENTLFQQGNLKEYDHFKGVKDRKLDIFYKFALQNDLDAREAIFRSVLARGNKSTGFAKTLYNGKVLSYKLKFFHSIFSVKPSKKSVYFNPKINLFCRNLFIMEMMRKHFFFMRFLRGKEEFLRNRSSNKLWIRWLPFINRFGKYSKQQNMFFYKIFGQYFTNVFQLCFDRFYFKAFMKRKEMSQLFYLKEYRDYFFKRLKKGVFHGGFLSFLHNIFREYYAHKYSVRILLRPFLKNLFKINKFSKKIRKNFFYNLVLKTRENKRVRGIALPLYVVMKRRWRFFKKLKVVQKNKRLLLRKKYFLSKYPIVLERRNFNLNPYFHFFRFFPFFFKKKFLDVFSFHSTDLTSKVTYEDTRSWFYDFPQRDIYLSPFYNRSFFAFRENLTEEQYYSWKWIDIFVSATFFYLKFLFVVFGSFFGILCFVKFFFPFFLFLKVWINFIIF